MTFDQIQTQFNGGISPFSKSGIPNACRFSRNLAIFEDADSVTLTPTPIKDSSNVVTDLVKWMVDANPYTSDRWGIGDTGNLYRTDGNTVWVRERSGGVIGNNGTGQGLFIFKDYIYYATSTTIGRGGILSTGPGLIVYNDDFFSDGILNLDTSNAASGNTYTIPVAISESATNKFTFKPIHDPIKVVQIIFGTKGTGDITITIHDSNNNVVASKTVTNINLPASGTYNFTFDTPWSPVLGQTYHMHFTSTVADGTLQTGTASDLSTVNYNMLFGILLADANFHPIAQHTNGVTGTIVIGNGNYLAQWDGSTYNPNQIALEFGFKVRILMKINEFIVAFCWRGSSIDSTEYGRAYFWDGISPYYNFSRELTQGTPNAVINSKNRMFGIFGSSGDIGLAPDAESTFRQIQAAPKLTTGSRVEVLPGAIGVWQKRTIFGVSNTNDSNAGTYNDPNAGNHVAGDTYTPPLGFEAGAYEFGNQSDRAVSYTSVSTEVLNLPFTPSTPVANPSNFQIGCVLAVGKTFYISYRDGSSYYVDKVTKGNNPSSFGSWESLIDDHAVDKLEQYKQMPQKMKTGIKLRVTFASLPTGCTVTAKYRMDRSSAWIFGATATAGATAATALLAGIGGGRYREIEYGFDITATVNYPLVTSIGLFFELNEKETDSGYSL